MKIESEKIVKFAVIGCGHIGKRHAEMITRNPNSELVGLVDVKERSELSIENYDVPFFRSLTDLLHSKLHKNIDVLCIATPNGYHASQAVKALNHGLNVVIEKPMALNKVDAENVLNASLLNNKSVFTVMQNRYSPPSEWIKSVIENQILGEIYMVQLNCFWNRDDRYYSPDSWHGSAELDGGTLFTQFSHFIDMCFWIFGDMFIKNAVFKDFNHSNLSDFEDSGLVQFELLNGALGTLNYSTSVWDQNLESSMTIIGQNGSVKIGGQYMDKVEYCHIKDYEMPLLSPTNPGNDYGSYKGSAQNHNYVIENVVNFFHGKDVIKTNALEGLKIVEIIEKIYSFK